MIYNDVQLNDVIDFSNSIIEKKNEYSKFLEDYIKQLEQRIVDLRKDNMRLNEMIDNYRINNHSGIITGFEGRLEKRGV